MKHILAFLVLAVFSTVPLPAQTPTMHVKLKNGVSLNYSLADVRWISFGSGINATKPTAGVLRTFSLFRNYPNPFNPSTTIEYQIPRGGEVKVQVFAVTGQLVRELVRDHPQAGRYALIWDGRNGSGLFVASGVYFYTLTFERQVLSQKMVLLK